MKTRSSARLVLAMTMCILLMDASVALARTNTVSNTKTSVLTITPAVDQFRPTSCTIAVTNAVLGSGNFTGTNANDLMFGSTGADVSIRGGQGNDCLMGGGGNDTLQGDAGTDTCIGGPGTDTFNASCETQIQ